MKNKLWRKLSAGFLAVALAASMLPATALASEIPFNSEAEIVETDEPEEGVTEGAEAGTIRSDAEGTMEAAEETANDSGNDVGDVGESDGDETGAETEADSSDDGETEERYWLEYSFTTDGTNQELVGDEIDAVAFSYSGEYDYQYGDDEWHYVAGGSDLTVTLTENEESGVSLPEGYRVEWNLKGEACDYGYITCDVNGDGSSVTITVNNEAMLADGCYDSYFGMSADIYYGDSWVCCAEDWMDVLASYENYDLPGDQTVVAGEELWISDSVSCDYRNAKEPYGASEDVRITAMKNLNQTPESGEAGEGAVIELDTFGDEDFTFYCLSTLNYGTAEVQVTYLALDGEEMTCTITVSVMESYYVMYDIWAADGENTENLLVGNTRIYETEVYHIWNDESGDINYDSYGTTDFADESEYFLIAYYDDDFVSVDIADGCIEVTGKADGYTEVTVVYAETDTYLELASISFNVNVTSEGYCTIAASAEQVALGYSIDLNDLDYIVTHYYLDEDGSTQSETVDPGSGAYRVRLDTDTVDWNSWAYAEGSSEEELLPTLTRAGTDDTDFRLILDRCDEETGAWEEWIADCWIFFDEVWYDTNYDAYYGDEISYDNLFIGSEAAFEIYGESNNEYDLPDGYTVDWYLFTGEYEAVEEDSTDFTWEVKDNILYVTPHESAEDLGLIIYGYVYYEGSEISFAGGWTYSCISNGTSEVYAQMSDTWILPGESTTAAGIMITYSDAHPNGLETAAEVTEVEITEQYTFDSEEPTTETIAEVGTDNLTVTGVSYGWVELAVTCRDADGNKVICDASLYVIRDIYYLNLEEDSDYEICGPGEDTEIEVILYHAYVNDDNISVREETSYSNLSFESYYYDAMSLS